MLVGYFKFFDRISNNNSIQITLLSTSHDTFNRVINITYSFKIQFPINHIS